MCLDRSVLHHGPPQLKNTRKVKNSIAIKDSPEASSPPLSKELRIFATSTHSCYFLLIKDLSCRKEMFANNGGYENNTPLSERKVIS